MSEYLTTEEGIHLVRLVPGGSPVEIETKPTALWRQRKSYLHCQHFSDRRT